MKLNYATYLQLEKLLDLQQPRSDPAEHDETLFIVIHQVYELWFKQTLHEVDLLKRLFSANQVFRSISTLKRLRMIMKTLVAQLDILETMTPLSFSAFRSRLDTASGFQSVQFREFEFAMGYKRAEVLQYIDPEWPGYDRVRTRLAQPSVVDHFYELLEHHDVEIPQHLRDKDPQAGSQADEQIQRGLLRLYREKPEMAILFEMMTDVDEGLQEWRYRHVKIIERTIGKKTGTGGSPGVEFLKRSLFQPIFPDLWAIRQHM